MDFAIHPTAGEMVAATHGRSLWILDISALRQLTPDAIKADAALYRPTSAIRWKAEPARGRTNRRFAGENPTAGGKVYYSLAKKAEKVSLKVLDVDGKTVLRDLTASTEPGLHAATWPLNRTGGGRGGAGGGGGGGGGGGRRTAPGGRSRSRHDPPALDRRDPGRREHGRRPRRRERERLRPDPAAASRLLRRRHLRPRHPPRHLPRRPHGRRQGIHPDHPRRGRPQCSPRRDHGGRGRPHRRDEGRRRGGRGGRRARSGRAASGSTTDRRPTPARRPLLEGKACPGRGPPASPVFGATSLTAAAPARGRIRAEGSAGSRLRGEPWPGRFSIIRIIIVP